MRSGLAYSKGKIPAMRNMICFAFLLLAVSFCWSFSFLAFAEESAKPEQIILTWVTDPVGSQTITWLMPDNSPAQVQYLKADGYNGNFDSAGQLEASGTIFDSVHYRYTVNLTGLTPDTKYIYRLGCKGVWSEPLSFTTAADTGKFSFLYMGDVQSGYTEWGTALNSVYQSYPQIRFSLLGGDLTDEGNDENEWGQFLDAATVVFSRISMMPNRGNHDGYMFTKFFALPDNGPEGLKQEFYSFDYGNAHFVVLNSNNNTDAAVKQWLQNDLQSSIKKWKLVIFHHPAYPAATDYKGIDKSICANWVPILEQNNVDMVFIGHQHEYMRTHPVYQDVVQTAPTYGIVYVMGNAGSKTYAAGGGFPYIAREQTGSNYQLIDIDGDVLTLTAKNTSGELIESYMINKGFITAPALVADITNNVAGQAVELTFEDDATWRKAITQVSVNGTPIRATDYTVADSQLTINAGVFNQVGDYCVVVRASGYNDATITQKIFASMTISCPSSGQVFMPGQPVAIKGTLGGGLNSVNLTVRGPDGQTVYGPAPVPIIDGNLDTSFTPGLSAALGTYTIILEGAGIASAVQSNFIIKSDNDNVDTPEGEVALTITGTGVTRELNYTLAQLQEKEQYQQVYSAINTWPSKKWYVGKGVKLKDLLVAAGIKSNAGLIKFISQDGYTLTLTVKELLDDERYLFSLFMSTGSDSEGQIAGSSGAAQEVEPILALLSAEGTDNPAYMNDLDSLLLMLGQRAVTEQTAQSFIKCINKIEVLSISPPKWDNPQANPGSGEVSAGTLVRLRNANMDDDKIYYTTDGSTPTVNSPMYNWIANRWWSSRGDTVVDSINHPIEINKNTIIKAVTIGPGKRDSDVVSFSYQVKESMGETNGTVTPSEGCTVSLGSEAMIEVPANALNETGSVEVTIQKLSARPAVPAGLKLAGSVYEFSVGGNNSYSFARNVTIKLSFDLKAINTGESPAIHYYDETLSKWVNIGGTVSGNTVTVQVEHLAKFAVLATITAAEKPVELLTDVAGNWAAVDINKLLASGAIGGYPDGSFKPGDLITRAEFTTVLIKAFKLELQSGKDFSDTANHWAKNYIATATAYKILNGYSDTCFGPDDFITREQMAVMISKVAKLAPLAEETQFVDSGSISGWARGAIAAVTKNEIMKGYPDNTIQPQENATRAEAVTVIMNAINYDSRLIRK